MFQPLELSVYPRTTKSPSGRIAGLTTNQRMLKTPLHICGYLCARLVLITLVMSTVALISCSDQAPAQSQASPQLTVVKTAGSTTIYPSIVALSEAFEKSSSYPYQAVLRHEAGPGSSEGLKALIRGETDIARLSRDLKASELQQLEADGIDTRVFCIAIDAVAIVIHPERAASFRQLSVRQLRKIFFEKTVTDWSQIRADQTGAIRAVCSNPDLSGTAAIFRKTVAGNSKQSLASTCQIVEQTNHISQIVSSDPNAIGVLSLSVAQANGLTALSITTSSGHTVVPNVQNVRQGHYPLSRNLNLCVRKPIHPTLANFLLFTLSPSGQAILESQGFNPIR